MFLLQLVPKLTILILQKIVIIILLILLIFIATSGLSLMAKIISGLVILLNFIIISFTLLKYSEQMNYKRIIFHYICELFNSRLYGLFFYIPIFLVLTIGYIAFLILVYSSISSGDLSFDPTKDIFWKPNPSLMNSLL